MRRPGWMTVLVAGSGLVTALAAAPSELEVRLEEIDPARFPALTLKASVLDRSGFALKLLEKRHFAAFENDELIALDGVDLDTDPVSMVLALDGSGSMTPTRDALRQAAANLLRLLDPADAAAVLEFAAEPSFLAGFGDSRQKAIDALNAVVPYGPTALYDALYRGLLELGPRPGRKNLVVITDGRDQNALATGPGSRRTEREVIDLAISQGTPIHCLALGRGALRLELARLSRETGGRAYGAVRAESLNDLYRRLISNLRARLAIRAKTRLPRLDGSYRRIVLRVRSGEAFGEDKGLYGAPARFALDLDPVAYKGRQLLDPARRGVHLKDTELVDQSPGDRDSLLGFLDRFFRFPTAAP